MGKIGQPEMSNSAVVSTPPAVSSLPTDPRIELQVGEKVFFVSKSTLIKGSTFFASMFTSTWQTPPTDGIYFLDRNGSLFTHILAFLRSGAYPIFFDRVHGHDYTQYHALLKEAQYFKIPGLISYLSSERYQEILKIEKAVWVIYGMNDTARKFSSGTSTLEFVPMAPEVRKVYLCPRGIAVHRGDPGQCGRLCHEAQEGFPIEFDEEHVVQTLAVRTKVVYNWEM